MLLVLHISHEFFRIKKKLSLIFFLILKYQALFSKIFLRCKKNKSISNIYVINIDINPISVNDFRPNNPPMGVKPIYL
jgi:hypothetical protein